MAVPRQPCLDIWNPSMIDIPVGAGKPPCFRISGEVGGHILMNVLLKIEAERVAVGANDDINANAAITRNVTAWIGQPDIGRIIVHGDADLRLCGGDELVGSTDLRAK